MSSIYSSNLTGNQFMYYEIRITAKLLQEGMTREEITAKIKEENLFQLPTEKKVSSIINACFKRIDAMNSEELTELLATSTSEIGMLINLYAMMKTYRLVEDFMITVIGEKYRTQDFSFSSSDLNTFFFRLQEQDEEVATWSDRTISELKGVLRRSLIACGYIDSVKSDRLNPIYLFPEIEDQIRSKGDYAVLPAFNCLR